MEGGSAISSLSRPESTVSVQQESFPSLILIWHIGFVLQSSEAGYVGSKAWRRVRPRISNAQAFPG